MKYTPFFGFIIILLVSCATVTTGTKQEIAVSTNPVGANCTIYQEGIMVNEAKMTPATITISKADVSVVFLCKKKGYLDNTGVLAANYEGMTWGNVLIGGLIGFAIDATSGSVRSYTPEIMINMIPDSFGSITERDVFFDSLKNEVNENYSVVKEKLSSACENKKDCKNKLLSAKMLKREEIDKIEKQRRYAVISSVDKVD